MIAAIEASFLVLFGTLVAGWPVALEPFEAWFSRVSTSWAMRSSRLSARGNESNFESYRSLYYRRILLTRRLVGRTLLVLGFFQAVRGLILAFA